jgi:hypothetical protein
VVILKTTVPATVPSLDYTDRQRCRPRPGLPPRSGRGSRPTASIEPARALADPLADVSLHGPITDRFVIQPGDITLITVGSIEIITHPSDGEDETKPTTPPTGRPSKLVEPLTDRDMSLPAASRWASA